MQTDIKINPNLLGGGKTKEDPLGFINIDLPTIDGADLDYLHSDIHSRLVWLNYKYQDILNTVGEINQNNQIALLRRISYQKEEFVYHLRKNCDMMLILTESLFQIKKNGHLTSFPQMNSIGGYYSMLYEQRTKNMDYKDYYLGNCKFLNDVNDISNQYKHSAQNTIRMLEDILLDTDKIEPLEIEVFKQNKKIERDLNDLIYSFNLFYASFNHYLRGELGYKPIPPTKQATGQIEKI